MATKGGMEQAAAAAHVDRFVRIVLGVSHNSVADLPAMPEHLSRRLLRTEETESDARDQWGRWEFGRSESFRRGELWRPEVDEWLLKIQERVGDSACVPRWPEGHSFAVCPTHDVDMVTRTWTPKQIVRSIHAALTGSDRGTSRAEAVLHALGRAAVFRTSPAPSSTATLERCLDIELARNVRGTYFFTIYPRGRVSLHDCMYTLDDRLTFREGRRRVRDVVVELVQAGFDVGLHGSYASATDTKLLSTQRVALEEAVGAEVQTIRQHWLRWDARTTPAAQAAAGFAADSTLGFNRNVGFRAGTSCPFFLYAPEPFRALEILEIPLVAQESALFAANALELDEPLAREVVETLVDRVARVGGVFTFLVHPHSLLDGRVASLYAWILDYALDRGAWVASIAEVDSWWRRRAQALTGAHPEPSTGAGVGGWG